MCSALGQTTSPLSSTSERPGVVFRPFFLIRFLPRSQPADAVLPLTRMFIPSTQSEASQQRGERREFAPENVTNVQKRASYPLRFLRDLC